MKRVPYLRAVPPHTASLASAEPLDKALHAAGVEALSRLANLVVLLRERYKDEAAQKLSRLHQRLAETMTREVWR